MLQVTTKGKIPLNTGTSTTTDVYLEDASIDTTYATVENSGADKGNGMPCNLFNKSHIPRFKFYLFSPDDIFGIADDRVLDGS